MSPAEGRQTCVFGESVENARVAQAFFRSEQGRSAGEYCVRQIFNFQNKRIDTGHSCHFFFPPPQDSQGRSAGPRDERFVQCDRALSADDHKLLVQSAVEAAGDGRMRSIGVLKDPMKRCIDS